MLCSGAKGALKRNNQSKRPAPQPKEVTLRSVTRFTVVLGTLIGCVGCDQATKSAARSFLNIGKTESLFHDVLRLQVTENRGAFLSLGASLSAHLRFVFFTAASAVLLLGLAFATLFAKRLSQWQIGALAMIVGGGASNLLDRLTDAGRVTDFLNVGIGPVRTGIFNLADMAILAGATFLVIGRGARRRNY
jgi:signal peptidase II